MEKYRLLKDLPNAKAGEIFEYAAEKTQQLETYTDGTTVVEDCATGEIIEEF